MEYLHTNGYRYSQEEVEQAAAEKGLSVEEYLASEDGSNLKSVGKDFDFTDENLPVE